MISKSRSKLPWYQIRKLARRLQGNVVSGHTLSVVVDVGTPTCIELELGECSTATKLHSSISSMLIKVTRQDTDTVVVVRWGVLRDKECDMDHISSLIGSTAVNAPLYTDKRYLEHEGKYVSIGQRSYIPGSPLSQCWDDMSSNEIESVYTQVARVLTTLRLKVSDHFGHINDGAFKTSTTHSYISHHVVREALLYGVGAGITGLLSENAKYNGNPRFCHRSLMPEHIIVNSNTVSGIVGWSGADFVPEVLDRVRYAYTARLTLWSDWAYKLSSIPVCDLPGEVPYPIFFNVAAYVQRVERRAGGGERVHEVDSACHNVIRSNMSVDVIRCTGDAQSDTASLTALTDETIDTWEKATAT